MPNPERTTAEARTGSTEDDPRQPPVINALSPKLPVFWSSSPRVWIRRIESQFRTSGVTSQQTKFDLTVQHLDEATSVRLQDFILNPPATSPYDALVQRLSADFGKSTYEHLVEFFSQPALGDRRPSELASAILQSVAGIDHDVQSCPFVHHAFLSRLPESVRTPLSDVKFEDMRAMAVKADKLWSTSRPSTTIPVLAVEEPPTEFVAAVQDGARRPLPPRRR